MGGRARVEGSRVRVAEFQLQGPPLAYPPLVEREARQVAGGTPSAGGFPRDQREPGQERGGIRSRPRRVVSDPGLRVERLEERNPARLVPVDERPPEGGESVGRIGGPSVQEVSRPQDLLQDLVSERRGARRPDDVDLDQARGGDVRVEVRGASMDRVVSIGGQAASRGVQRAEHLLDLPEERRERTPGLEPLEPGGQDLARRDAARHVERQVRDEQAPRDERRDVLLGLGGVDLLRSGDLGGDLVEGPARSDVGQGPRQGIR